MKHQNVKQLIKQEINKIIAGYACLPARQGLRITDYDYQIEYPPQSELGDYSCNVAMILAKKLKKNPLELAQEIKEKIGLKNFAKVEVAKPGFINFYLSEKYLEKKIKEILRKKDKFGQQKNDKAEKIQVEFISANPTGPLTLANGRGGFSGDVLANVLELAGHKVQREYLVNDYGNQVNNLAESLRITHHNIKELGFNFEEKKLKILKKDSKNKNLYKGNYIIELLKKFEEEHKEKTEDLLNNNPEYVGKWATNEILENYIKPAIKKAGIKFDNYFSERKLHESGKVDKMLEVLKNKNLVYEKDGAIWLKTTEHDKSDDEKDRVLVKSDGSKTYFLADIAYHWNKFHDRKFNKVINLWGADHHGYVARMKSAVAMLGYEGQLDILIMQLVKLIENGKEKKMSKRQGVYVLLEDLIDKVGLDVTRFFFLMHANNKSMDFDLDLAQEKSKNNPAFYVQYAHARICSILDKAKNGKIEKAKNYKFESAEKELIKELIKWPELISDVAKNYEVHKICFYTIALADKFHNFYEKCQVIENGKVAKHRLEIITATQQVLQNSLDCLGVSSPEKM